MPARSARCVLAAVMHIRKVSAGFGADTVSGEHNATHIDGRIFISASERAGQGIDDSPEAIYAGFDFCVADERKQLPQVSVARAQVDREPDKGQQWRRRIFTMFGVISLFECGEAAYDALTAFRSDIHD
jgi:hypothetical protein